MKIISEKSSIEVLKNILDNILEFGNEELLSGFAEIPIISIGRVVMEFDCDSNVFAFPSYKDRLFSLADTIYRLSGRNDSKYIEFYKEYFRVFAPIDGFFENAFGKRMYEVHGNQLVSAVMKIKKNKRDAKAVIFFNGNDKDLIDCTLTAQISCHDGKHLDMMINYRANDVLEYLSHDFFFFSYLLRIISSYLDLELGRIILVSDRVYIQKNQIDSARKYYEKLMNFTKCNFNHQKFEKSSIDSMRKYMTDVIDKMIAYNSRWITKDELLSSIDMFPNYIKKIVSLLLMDEKEIYVDI